MLAIALPGGLLHRYDYDACGKVVRQQFADGRIEHYERDARGLPDRAWSTLPAGAP